jgi:uncharacterized repeat protein (TIGR02543 family)
MIIGLVFISLTLASCDEMFKDNSLSVVFYTGKGATVVPTAYDLKVGDKVPEPEEPTSDAGDFIGWYKDINYTEIWDFDTDTLTKSITLYAKWEFFTFTITYDLRGGNWPGDQIPSTYPQTYTYFTSRNFPTKQSEYPIYPKGDPENPYKGLFLGWWEEPDLTAEQRKSIPKTEMIKQGTVGNKTFYAYYSQDK